MNLKTSITLLVLAGKIVFTTEGHIWLNDLSSKSNNYLIKKLILHHNHLIVMPKENKNPEEIIHTAMLSHSKEHSLFKISDTDLNGEKSEQHITAFFRLRQKYIKDIKEHPNGPGFVKQHQETIDNLFEIASNTVEQISDN